MTDQQGSLGADASVGIVGGGTMGLTLAYRLARAGRRVTVFESQDRLGGLSTWFDYGDFTWDKYYHVVCPTDSAVMGLIDDLGISSSFRWGQTKTGFLWDGRHLSMSSHWEFLTFPALNLLDKVRLAIGILRCQRIKDPSALERMKASEWLSRMFGRRVYERIWAPLVASKYGELGHQVPATIMWATINRYYATRSKGGGKESMGFLSGGLKTLFDALGSAIESHGGEILCPAPVESIAEHWDDSQPGKAVVTTKEKRFEFDQVIVCTPTAALRRIAPTINGLCPDEQSPGPLFLGVICLTLILKRPLSKFYITNLMDRRYPFTGVIEVSNLTGTEELGGNRLTMLPRYDVPDSSWFDREPEDVAEQFLAAMRPVWPDIDENLKRFVVNRERRVQALWTEPPPAQPRALRNESGTVWAVHSEMAGRDTLNNNAIVGVANRTADELLGVKP